MQNKLDKGKAQMEQKGAAGVTLGADLPYLQMEPLGSQRDTADTNKG